MKSWSDHLIRAIRKKGVEHHYGRNLYSIEPYLRILKQLDGGNQASQQQLYWVANEQTILSCWWIFRRLSITLWCSWKVKSVTHAGFLWRGFAVMLVLCLLRILLEKSLGMEESQKKAAVGWVVMAVATQTKVHRCETSITRVFSWATETRVKRMVVIATDRQLLICSYSVSKNKKPYYHQA